MSTIASEAPRVQQTLRLPVSKLQSPQEWAIVGSGLTASARVKDPNGRIALIKNRWTDGWFLPGGEVEPDETPVEAARREVQEETGLSATIEDPLVVLNQTYVSELMEMSGSRRFSWYIPPPRMAKYQTLHD